MCLSVGIRCGSSSAGTTTTAPAWTPGCALTTAGAASLARVCAMCCWGVHQWFERCSTSSLLGMYAGSSPGVDGQKGLRPQFNS
eukprot:1195691-Prorocentrum_minimum.AAC.3